MKAMHDVLFVDNNMIIFTRLHVVVHLSVTCSSGHVRLANLGSHGNALRMGFAAAHWQGYYQAFEHKVVHDMPTFHSSDIQSCEKK